MAQKVWRRNFAAGFGLEKALEAARSSSAPVAIQSPPAGSSPEEVSLSFDNLDIDHVTYYNYYKKISFKL